MKSPRMKARAEYIEEADAVRVPLAVRLLLMVAALQPQVKAQTQQIAELQARLESLEAEHAP
jgi:hypothetical protein